MAALQPVTVTGFFDCEGDPENAGLPQKSAFPIIYKTWCGMPD
jgi:hypothetical protein